MASIWADPVARLILIIVFAVCWTLATLPDVPAGDRDDHDDGDDYRWMDELGEEDTDY